MLLKMISKIIVKYFTRIMILVVHQNFLPHRVSTEFNFYGLFLRVL